jgi:hypothetical protein
MIADAIGVPVSFFIQYQGMPEAAFREESQGFLNAVREWYIRWHSRLLSDFGVGV